MYFPSPSFCWSPFSISIIFPYLSTSFHHLCIWFISFFQCPFHSVNSQSFTVDFPRCVVSSEDLGGSAAKTGAAIPRSRNPIQQMCGSSGCGERLHSGRVLIYSQISISSIWFIFWQERFQLFINFTSDLIISLPSILSIYNTGIFGSKVWELGCIIPLRGLRVVRNPRCKEQEGTR